MNPTLTTGTSTDFRRLIQAKLIERCKKNPHYSLRAFARSLGVDSSYISKLLKGKRRISLKVIERLGPQLDLSPAQLDGLRAQAKAKRQADASSFAENEETSNYLQLTHDSFQVIADWYHYAILELITTKGFEENPKWIATALGIKVPEVNDALERLIRLGFLSRDAKGKLLLETENHTTVGSPYTAAALRQLQRQILQMGITALEETPIEERDQSAITMAIDSELLPVAKEKIKKFRRELCDFLQTNKKRDRVYHLSVSLYPVSKKPLPTPLRKK